jgi:hypothetical protein
MIGALQAQVADAQSNIGLPRDVRLKRRFLLDQCDINVGTVMEARIPRVAPPRTNSRMRE